MEVNKDAHSHHISQKFNEELEVLKTHLLEMGGQVQRQINDAVKALIDLDSNLAEAVRDNDHQVNQMEMTIDSECTHILARRQPTASDLRLVIAVSKANTDLERIGDEAKHISRLAIQLSEKGKAPQGYVEIRHISDRVTNMVSNALDAFARLDVDLALKVVREDEKVDLEYGTALRELITYMMEDPRSIGRVMNVIWVLRSLERAGDHAINIAEQVIYLVKGEDVRHVSYESLKAKVQADLSYSILSRPW